MSEWRGGGEHHFQCDYCDKKSEVEKTNIGEPLIFHWDIPEGWYFIRLGTLYYENDSGETRHFCSREHAVNYLRDYPDISRTSDKLVE